VSTSLFVQTFYKRARAEILNEIANVEKTIEELSKDFNPELHPRDAKGRFGEGGGAETKLMDWQTDGSLPKVAEDWQVAHVSAVIDEYGDSLVGDNPLTQEEGQAALTYSADGFSAMNELARDGYVSDATLEEAQVNLGLEPQEIQDQTQTDVDNLRSAIDSSTVDTDVTVFRGVQGGWLSGLQKGDVITDKGFVSTSLKEGVAGGFGGGQSGSVVEINIPKGSNALGIAKGEGELLLNSGSQFRVEQEAGVGHAVLTYIGAGNTEKSLEKAEKKPSKPNRFSWTEGDVEITKNTTKSLNHEKSWFIKDWDESKHPRGAGGRFGSGGGTKEREGRRITNSTEPFDKITQDALARSGKQSFNGEKEQAQVLKAQISAEIAKSMTSSTLDLGVAEGRLRRDDNLQRLSEDGDRAVREACVSTLVGQWARTSNDSESTALAMQQAAAEEFGIKGHAGWTEASESSLRGAQENFGEHGEVYKDFFRAQYEATQAEFVKQGIGPDDTLLLYRGLENTDLPPTGTTFDAQLRPLNSYSTDPLVARRFADSNESCFATEVQAKDILSMPATGNGCLNEREMVVLGGVKESTVVSIKLDIGQMNELGTQSYIVEGLPDETSVTKATKQTINVDNNLINSDWIKTGSWDFPDITDLASYASVNGVNLKATQMLSAQLQHAMALPSWIPAPQKLKDEAATYLRQATKSLAKEWDETKHPRGAGGRFASGGGETSGSNKIDVQNTKILGDNLEGLDEKAFRDYLQKNGTSMEGQKCPEFYGKGEPNRCFDNATDLVLDSQLDAKPLRYCEGLVEFKREPGYSVLHAWAVDAGGNVIDNTLGMKAENCIYNGVTYDNEKYAWHCLASGTSGVIGGLFASRVLDRGGL
jgi:hypothetical protein